MKENPQNNQQAKPRPSAWRLSVLPAAIIAVIQACLTISGMGIEGFVLWVLIIFVAYWLFFTLLIWIWRRSRSRA
jgi:hypothetical protein